MDISLLPYRPDRDVYRLLGVPPNAGRVEIVAACRRLARAFHPDRNVSQRATEEMQVVNAVRSLLTDSESRAEYDHERLSFLQATGRQRPAEAPPAVTGERAAAPAFTRRARAAMAGMLAALKSLAPARCASCDTPIEPSYRFCGRCGSPL